MIGYGVVCYRVIGYGEGCYHVIGYGEVCYHVIGYGEVCYCVIAVTYVRVVVVSLHTVILLMTIWNSQFTMSSLYALKFFPLVHAQFRWFKKEKQVETKTRTED